MFLAFWGSVPVQTICDHFALPQPLQNGHFYHLFKIVPFLECEVLFSSRFLAQCDSNVVLAFFVLVLDSLLFCDVHEEKGTKILQMGTRLWPIYVFFFNECAWKNTMRASMYNMEIKITGIIVLNLGLSVLEKHMRSC